MIRVREGRTCRVPHGSSNQIVFRFLCIIACVVLLVGAFSLADAQPDEATLFTEGYQAYLKGETDKAIETLNAVLTQYPKGRVRDVTLYWLGKSYQKTGRTQEALAAFRELKAQFPQSAMVGHAARQVLALEKQAPSEQATPPDPTIASAPPVEPSATLKPQAPPDQPPLAKFDKSDAPPIVVAAPAPQPTTAPKVAASKEAVKPARPKQGSAPPAKASRRPLLSAPPAGESVFLVVGQVAGLEVTDVGGRHVAIAGDAVMVSFEVMNRGNADDAFLLAATLPPSYQAVFVPHPAGSGSVNDGDLPVTETPRLGVGERARFILKARLPSAMSDGMAQLFEIKVSSKSDSSVSHSAPTTLVASAPVLRGTVVVDHTKVKPGDPVSHTLSLSNVGSADARSAKVIVTYPGSLRLIQTAPPASSVDPHGHTVTWDLARMAPKDRPVVRLDFRVSDGALADQELGVQVVLQSTVGEHTVAIVSPTSRVEAVAGVRVAAAEAFRTVFPRETLVLPFTLRNTGNAADRFALKVEGGQGNGVLLVEDRNRDGVRQQDEPVVEMTRLLTPQEEIMLLTELSVPAETLDATRHAIRLAATSERSRSVVAETGSLVVIARPMVAVATQMTTKESTPGKVFSYQLVATNTGTSPARRVLVSERLPPELEFVDAQPKPGQIEGQRLAWEIADLGSGQQEVLTVGVRIKKGLAAGTAVRKATMVRYRDMKEQLYESSPAGEGP